MLKLDGKYADDDDDYDDICLYVDFTGKQRDVMNGIYDCQYL